MLLKVIFQTTRPSFLILTPICIALAVSTALLTSSYVNLTEVALILMAGLMAHVSVNAINEYADFKSGLDLLTEKTPFSGGSGALPSHPKAAFAVLIVGISSIVITSLIGLYFLWQKGLALLPLGLMGVFLVVSYTHWLNRMPLLCLIAPGLGLGVVMVIGSHWVLVGEFSNINIFLALVPFFLFNNLLLLNQYPDMKADAKVDRRTLPIVYGVTISNIVYGVFMLLAYGVIVVLVIFNYLSSVSLWALLPMIFALYALFGAVKMGNYIAQQPQYLAANVAAAILTPLLLVASISISL